jgi:hypothetical protein
MSYLRSVRRFTDLAKGVNSHFPFLVAISFSNCSCIIYLKYNSNVPHAANSLIGRYRKNGSRDNLKNYRFRADSAKYESRRFLMALELQCSFSSLHIFLLTTWKPILPGPTKLTCPFCVAVTVTSSGGSGISSSARLGGHRTSHTFNVIVGFLS